VEAGRPIERLTREELAEIRESLDDTFHHVPGSGKVPVSPDELERLLAAAERELDREEKAPPVLDDLSEARKCLRRFIAETRSHADNELYDAVCCVVTHLERGAKGQAGPSDEEPLFRRVQERAAELMKVEREFGNDKPLAYVNTKLDALISILSERAERSAR
jgi:hypothetical protein